MKVIKVIVTGQPGSGKTVVAALISQLLKQYYSHVEVKSRNVSSILDGSVLPREFDVNRAEVTILDNDSKLI